MISLQKSSNKRSSVYSVKSEGLALLVEVLCGSGQGIGGSSGPPCLGIDGAVSLGEGWGSDVVVGISSFLIPLSVPFPLVSGTSLWGVCVGVPGLPGGCWLFLTLLGLFCGLVGRLLDLSVLGDLLLPCFLFTCMDLFPVAFGGLVYVLCYPIVVGSPVLFRVFPGMVSVEDVFYA